MQAIEWYTSVLGQARWNQYSPEQEAQLITTFYTRGNQKMAKPAKAQIAQLGSYTPDLTSDGSAYVGSGSER